jgi:hypothetical protein
MVWVEQVKDACAAQLAVIDLSYVKPIAPTTHFNRLDDVPVLDGHAGLVRRPLIFLSV